jgi:hypothetical protein
MKKIRSVIEDQIRSAPLTIEPFYFCKYPNEVCEIYNGSLLVENYKSDVCRIGSGNIIQQWLPEPSIRYCMTKDKEITPKQRVEIDPKDYLSLGKSKSTLTVYLEPITFCSTKKKSQPIFLNFPAKKV